MMEKILGPRVIYSIAVLNMKIVGIADGRDH